MDSKNKKKVFSTIETMETCLNNTLNLEKQNEELQQKTKEFI